MADAWALPHLRGERYEFTSPTPDGVEHIAANLRLSDAEEAFATTGHRDYLAALRLSLAHSRDAVMGVTCYGEPAALFGVSTVSLIYNIGSPWLLATDSAMAHRRAFIEAAGQYTAAMLQEYASLENHVDVRNKISVAWLQRLGFKMEAPVPYGALGLPFHPFHIER